MIRISRTIPRRCPFISSSPSRTFRSKSGVTRTPCPHIAKKMLSPPNSSPVSAGSDVPKCTHPFIRRGQMCFNNLPALTARRRIHSILSLSTAFILANILLIDKQKFFIRFLNRRHFSKKEFFFRDRGCCDLSLRPETGISASISSCVCSAFSDSGLSGCIFSAFSDSGLSGLSAGKFLSACFAGAFPDLCCPVTGIPAILIPFFSGLSVSKRN